MSPEPGTPPSRESHPAHTGVGVRALRVLTSIVLSVLLPLAVLGAAVFGAKKLLDNPPRAVRRTAEHRAPLVRVRTVAFARHDTAIAAMGIVRASRVVEIRPRVAGEVVEVHPRLERGGLLAAGDVLVRIDPSDFELAIRQREADLARATSALHLEEGREAVARREFEILGEEGGTGRRITTEEKALLLRVPQREAAEAEIATAEAALAKARLDLERTRVLVPFAAIVRTDDVDVGSQVSTGSRLATLACTDECWVEATVPLDRLPWIVLPGPGVAEGARARITGPGMETPRTGLVTRLSGDIESQGRLARILVTVPDALALREENRGLPPLLEDAFVRVDIEGRSLERAAALPRDLLRGGDRVWVADDEDRLRIRPVTIGFRERDTVFVTAGLEPGDRLVVSDLAAPVEAMRLRVEPDSSVPADTPGAASPGGGAAGER